MDFENSDKEKLGHRLRKLRLEKLVDRLELSLPTEVFKSKRPKGASRRSGAVELKGEDFQVAREILAEPKVPQTQVQSPKAKTGVALVSKEEESEIVLRRLIAANSEWRDMKAYAWDIFEKWPTTEIAGKIIELSYLHGSLDDLVVSLNFLRKKNIAAYYAVGVELRPYIVLNLWRQGREAVLNHFLHQKSFQGMLLRLEKLFVFWSLYGASDQAKAWRFYRQNDQDIHSAVQEYGRDLKLTPSYLNLELGKLAHSLGKHGESKLLLERIKATDTEFKEALDMLIRFKVDVDANGHCVFGRKLAAEKDWRNRIKLMRSFLESMDRSSGIRHQERTALNQILLKPMHWFPESAECLSSLSKTLVEFCSLEYVLPNIMQFYRDYSSKFQSAMLERAIWEPVFEIECNDEYKDSYWKGVASLHKYVGNYFRPESLLWQAKDLVDFGVQGDDKRMIPWNKLHLNLVNWASRNSNIDEAERQGILAKLRVAGHHLDINSHEIKDYIADLSILDFSSIQRMMSVVRKRSDLQGELALILKKGNLSHLTNRDLNRLWQISRSTKSCDLSWRVASILSSRRVLHSSLDKIWSLSGEKRQNRRIRPIPASKLPLVYGDWSKRERDFAESVLLIGHKLPELLSLLSRRVRPFKQLMASPEDRRFMDILPKSSWLIQGKKVYSAHPDRLVSPKSPYVELLPDTPWVRIWVQVAERLGIQSWRWDLTALHDSLGDLVSKLQKSPDKQVGGKVGRWLRSLSPMQRRAWYGLVNLQSSWSCEEAGFLLTKLVTRLAVTIYQDHVDALDSVAAMEGPLELKWDLESYLVSHNYSSVREAMFTNSSFDVPQSAQQDAIHIESEKQVPKSTKYG